jgi:outer membrane protein
MALPSRVLCRWVVLCFFSLATGTAGAQDTLTLEEALELAVRRNGTVSAAYWDLEAARARVRQTRALFLPTVVPSFRYDSQRRAFDAGAFTSDGAQTFISADWRLLDAGQRQATLDATRASAEGQEMRALQVLRGVIFDVHQQYLEALRSQELERVVDAQVTRAETILAQTKALVEAEEAPRKDILQAQADFLNARVQQITIRNRTAATEANLRALIGWDPAEPMPDLEQPSPELTPEVLPPLEALVQQGLERRPDLQAQREFLEAQRFNVRRARIEQGITWNVDASYARRFTPSSEDSRVLSFLVSYPLFDGGRLREATREQEAAYRGSEAALVQTERGARAEIESAYIQVAQNAERLQAATAALEAARVNYEAAAEAFRLGAAGTDIVTVLTAQVSLVTAESGYIEAVYDYYISSAWLRLVTGQPLLGETL